VIRHVRQRPLQGQQYGLCFSPSVNGQPKFLRLQIVEGVQHDLPAGVPAGQQLLARFVLFEELPVAITPRFFAIRGSEVGPT